MRIRGIPESTPGSLDEKLLSLFNTRLKIQPPIAKKKSRWPIGCLEVDLSPS